MFEQIMKETDFHQSSKKGGDKGANAAAGAASNDSAVVDGKESSKSKKVSIVRGIQRHFYM